MPCLFGKNEPKIVVGVRKVTVQKRRAKNSPEQISKVFYLPLLKAEVQQLRIQEGTLLRGEIGLVKEVEIESV